MLANVGLEDVCGPEEWGDGFADNSVFEAASVTSWSDVADGESLRFYPALRASDRAPLMGGPASWATLRRSP